MEEKCPEVIDALAFAPIGLYEPYRIIVQNNPVNFVDPRGLVSWRSVGNGTAAVVAGGIGIGVGATASASGVGAIVGVPVAIGGAVSLSWGVSEVITGILDNELPAKPSIATLATLATTCDVNKAAKNDLIADTAFFGLNLGAMAATIPGRLEMLGLGVDFINLSLSSKDPALNK
jgi:hypothetical protein